MNKVKIAILDLIDREMIEKAVENGNKIKTRYCTFRVKELKEYIGKST